MRAINHALTGAIIGLSLPSPLLALPLALASHFVCDAIPHYGGGKSTVSSKYFTIGLVVDALLCILLVLLLGFSQPAHWLLASSCAFLATAPDLLWIPGYIRVRNKKPFNLGKNWLMRFVSTIQWFERPIGAAVEFAWFIAASSVLFAITVA